MDRSARLLVAAALAATTAAGCGRSAEPDAYGNVEATEVTVTSEVGGQLLTFEAAEGQSLTAGQAVATIDAAPLTLQREQAAAQHAATASRGDEVLRQVPVLEAQREAALAQRQAAVAQRAALTSQVEIAQRTLARTERLIAQQAATAQQLDQNESAVRTLQEQIKAQDQQIEAQGRQVAAYEAQLAALRTQRETASQQTRSAAAQVAQVDDRIRRSQVTNPLAGTVLVTYAEVGEIVQAGQPLYRIADLSAVDVRAYVTETQLSAVKLGQRVEIAFDTAPETRQTLTGDITWIASEAEFTPTPIQTRDERSDLVYAIKVRVANDNRQLKIGMPVDVSIPDGR
jgi:HlyD family secretion protein